MVEFRLPDVGEGLHEAEILQWQVRVGDEVAQDQPLVDIQTDKATVQIPSPAAGRVAEIRVQEGTVARVGEVLVVIAMADERRPTVGDKPSAERSGARHAAFECDIGHRRVLAAPAVRKLALQLGVDLEAVRGTGPAGRVLPEDVRRHIDGVDDQRTAPGAQPSERAIDEPIAQRSALGVPTFQRSAEEPDERVALQGLRRRIAERMEQAWGVPHVTSFEEVDATRLVALREALRPEAERHGVRLTFLPLIVKAAVQALREHPLFNATLDVERREVLLRRSYHIGFAAAVPDGLLVPVVRHADRLSLLQLAAEIARLAEGARARTLSQAELSGSTFTITNYGSFGGLQGTPIINPPESAILGCGRIERRPVVVDDRIEPRPVLPLALSFDHRLIDGASAAQFLLRLRALLAAPELLSLF